MNSYRYIRNSLVNKYNEITLWKRCKHPSWDYDWYGNEIIKIPKICKIDKSECEE